MGVHAEDLSYANGSKEETDKTMPSAVAAESRFLMSASEILSANLNSVSISCAVAISRLASAICEAAFKVAVPQQNGTMLVLVPCRNQISTRR